MYDGVGELTMLSCTAAYVRIRYACIIIMLLVQCLFERLNEKRLRAHGDNTYYTYRCVGKRLGVKTV